MPSPLAHMGAGYMIHRVWGLRRAQSGARFSERVPLSTLVVLGLSVLPDVDSLAGIVMGDFGRFHNNWTHSLIAGLGVSLLVAGFASFQQRTMAREWFCITLICYGVHVMMDLFTIGRGVMALWPFSTERYASPIKLFYGLHWSDGWLSVRHLWTLITELGFIAVLNTIGHIWIRLRSCMQARRTRIAQES